MTLNLFHVHGKGHTVLRRAANSKGFMLGSGQSVQAVSSGQEHPQRGLGGGVVSHGQTQSHCKYGFYAMLLRYEDDDAH